MQIFNSLKNARILQEIDPVLVRKIEMFVKEGVSKVNEMRRQLKIAVKHELFGGVNVPPTSNRRYFPNRRIIRSYIVPVKRKLRHSMIDQESLAEKVKQWKEEQPNSRIFYRQQQSPFRILKNLNTRGC